MREFGITSIVLLVALTSIIMPADRVEEGTPDPPQRRIDTNQPIRESLRLLTYNTFLRPPPVSWGDRIDCRARRIGEKLAREALPRDIVALNETFEPGALTRLSEQLTERFPYQLLGHPSARGFRTNGGLSLLSRFPIESWTSERFDHCSGEFNDCLATKGFLWGLIRVSRHLKINVVATHMNSGRSASAQEARSKQLAQIREFITTKATFERWPTVLMGDINIDGLRWEPRDPSTGELTEYSRMMEFLGNTCVTCETAHCFATCNPIPVDAFRDFSGGWTFDAQGTREANTHNCGGSSMTPCTNLNRSARWRSRMRIDYIMHFGAPKLWPHMSVETVDTTSVAFEDNSCQTTYLSDHQGVEATLRIVSDPELRADSDAHRAPLRPPVQ